ncbi:CinA family protein [Litoribacter alkaliphilus]|uniref:CinA family protein n=1 Tax=Litoribacter ruber TaxID=702568 RepID=A0AAP2CGC0_9BACT|nr:CinA family protein [Litoribacter alkaliphilus]MBS9523019.1 CinA family protein [Litoribacter alkaliphilus]
MGKDKPIAFYKDVKDQLDLIKDHCRKNKRTIAVAESASSGALQLLFSAEEEAGLFFEGGLTVYNCEQKKRQLKVPLSLSEPCNGVSWEVSKMLALNICDLYQSDYGLALTGFASTFPEEGIFDLYAFGAASYKGELLFCEKIESEKETPEERREDYAALLIKKFAEYLEQKK